ncbi:MAG: hypothetical protein HY754_14685 [Nitrospirae bacterium]|nr:hypothetical protein [Nitrospirota bacterium]
MHTSALKLTKISKELSMIPEDKLDEVKDLIESILSKDKTKKKKIVQLEGIWEGKGFEKLNLKKELEY